MTGAPGFYFIAIMRFMVKCLTAVSPAPVLISGRNRSAARLAGNGNGVDGIQPPLIILIRDPGQDGDTVARPGHFFIQHPGA